jgi:adenosylcobinamide-phosphate synthase
VLMMAIAIDVAFGDPAGRLHPVSWLGSLYARGRRRLLRQPSPHRLVLAGGALVVGAAAVAAGAGTALVRLTREAGVLGVVLEACALKVTLSLRGLARAAHEVREELERHDLVAARRVLAFHLVSRPTAALDAPRVASAAIESVAENLTDAVVAPVCFFLAFGLPGAFAYRAINTADAMIGYREGGLEHFGKIAARLDDLLNLVPARLAALALILAAGITDGSARRAVTISWRDHARTASPNAGWTMAAMAGALGVVLEKPGAYRLGLGRLPDARDISRAVRLMAVASVITVGVISLGRSVV